MPVIFESLLVIAHTAFLVGFFLLSFGIGVPLLRYLRLHKTQDAFLIISLSCGLGAWLLSQLVMLLGILGLLSRLSLYGLLLILFLISVASCWKYRRLLKNLQLKRPDSLLQRGILIFCFLYFGACFLGLSGPDLSYDGLKYHLYFPRLYLESERIQFLPYNMLSAFPQNMEMLYLVGLLFGEGFARIPNVFFTLLSLLLLGNFVKEGSGKRGAELFTVLSFLTFPTVFYATVQTYVDIGSAFYGLCTLSCLIKGLRERDKKWFFVAGLLSAAGLGTKYLYFIQLTTLTFFLVCLRISLPQEKRFSLLPSILIFTGTALLFGSPWYLRNYLLTGNPTYPLFYSWFGGPYWSQTLEKGLLAVRHQFGPPKTPLNFILLPFFLLKEGYLFFAFTPLLFLLKNKKLKRMGFVAGFCIFEMVIWFFSLTFQMRYGMFWHLLSSILVGSALGCAFEEKYSLTFRRVIAFLVVFLSVISLRIPLATAFRSLSIPLGLKTREAFQLRYVESYAIMKYINESLSQDAKIASFGDARGYYCKRPFYPIHPDVSGYIDLDQMQNAEAYRQRLKEIGITHLIYNPRRTEIFRNRYPHWIQLQKELERQYLELIRKENGVSLYRLR